MEPRSQVNRLFDDYKVYTVTLGTSKFTRHSRITTHDSRFNIERLTGTSQTVILDCCLTRFHCC